LIKAVASKIQEFRNSLLCALCIFGWLISFQSGAQSPNNKVEISPRSCLLNKKQTTCVNKLIIRWRFEQPTDFCLKDDSASILFCEVAQTEGRKTIDHQLDKTTTFIVSNVESDEEIERLIVYVVLEKAEKKRRRYRHPWSIF